MTEEGKRWEEDFGPEEKLLYAHGFHRVRGLEDLWQLGSSNATPEAKEKKEPRIYTREEALELITERMD